VLHQTLDTCDGPTGVSLIPASVEFLSDFSQLHDEIAGEILRADFSPLFAPKPDEGCLISAHYDPGVGAADESAPIA
jgi:hypothetical protein